MAKARELRRRIKSVENTRQITKTMEMVATSKLKRAQDRVHATRPYAMALAELMRELIDPALVERYPLLRQLHGKPKRVALILITSNRGLCGGFNGNLIRLARDRIERLEAEGTEVELHGIGRKGIGFFRYIGRTLASARQDIGDRPQVAQADKVIAPLIERFKLAELDVVEVVFAKFNNPLSTPPTVLPILPIIPPSETEPDEAAAWKEGRRPGRPPEQPSRWAKLNYILRPSAEEIAEALLPLYVRNQMYRALVETAASEHGARRTAMKSATDNAGEMIDALRRTYHRARQAQITQEIAEIVGGAEGLKG
jgi:F-type H+-transporting ATPase subunit gamma